jgi:magnesium-protoporphyrin IX monomethyl ester (oxidative) cyclase
MYVRDHQRPAFHEALGVDPDWYAHEVFTKTSEISKQIFPITLDIEHPSWQKGLERAADGPMSIWRRLPKTGLGVLKRNWGGRPRPRAFVGALHHPRQEAHRACVRGGACILTRCGATAY